MAKFIQRPIIEARCVMELSEEELAALEAMAGYDVEHFLKVFYKEYGEHYLKPHEKGVRTLFASARQEGSLILQRATAARQVFEGAHRATRVEKPA